jgi:hypothetical protein
MINLYVYAFTMNVDDDKDEKGAKRIVKVDDNIVLQVLSVANGGVSENDPPKGLLHLD